jgi:hypothetical protein
MKGVDLVSVVIILLVVFFVYKMSQPGYRGLPEGFRGGEAIGGRGSGAAYQEIDFQNMTEEHKKKLQEMFRGGEAIGGRGSGAAYQEIDFQDMSEQDKKKLQEMFRGGFGAGVGGSGAAYQEIDFKDMTEEDKKQIKEAFESISPSEEVKGSYVNTEVLSPAPAALKQPRKPYNLLEELPPAPRGSISCLNAACCAETDFEWRTNQTGNYLQRTNNYKREFPDNCSAPLTELNLAFYKNAIMSKA